MSLFGQPSIFYNNVGEGLISKKLPRHVKKYLELEVLPRLEPISDERYWKELARWMMTAARQSYVLHDSRCYWCIDGMHIVEMTPSGFRYANVAALYEKYEDDVQNPAYDIIYDSWDDITEGELDEWKPCSKKIAALIDQNLSHSNLVHEEWNAKVPMEELLPDDSDEHAGDGE